MKSINVKRLAALAAGALFAGQVAHAAVHTDTLPTDKSWYLNSAIVIGANAKPADVVWAGNIAAAIGQMAFTEETKVAGASAENVTVKLETPSEVVMPAEGKTVTKNATLNENASNGEIDSGSEVTVTHTYVPDLAESQEVNFKFGPADSLQEGTAYITEKLHLDYANAVGHVNDNEFQLKAYTETGKFYYEVTVTGLGLDSDQDYKENATGSDYAIKNLYIPILGKKYKVEEINTSSDWKLVLVGYSNEVDLKVGETAEIPGTEYSVKLLDIDSDNSKAYLQLLDSQGNVVASDVVKEDDETDFDGILSTPVKVEAVFSGTENKFAKLALSSDRITLSNTGKVKEDFIGKGWDLEAVTVGKDTITLYVKYNGDDDQTYLSPEKGLSPGDAITIPGTKYGFLFGGFETKPSQTVIFDGSSKRVSAMDARGVKSDFLLYASKQLSFANASGDEKEAVVTISDIVGDRDLKIKIVKDTNNSDSKQYVYIQYDKDAHWTEDEEWSSSNSDIETVYLYYNNNGTKTVDENFTAIRLDLDNDGSYDVLYAVTFDNPQDPTKLYIYYAGFKVVDNSNALEVYTDDDNIADWNAEISNVFSDVKYKIGAEVNSETHEFKGWYLKDDSGNGSEITIPAYTVYDDEGSGSKAELKSPINLNEEAIDVAGVFKVDADSDTDSNPTKAYTDYGTEVKAESSSKVVIKVPIEQRQLKFFVGKLPEKVETSGVIEAKVGDTVTIGGVEVKVAGVEGVGEVTYKTAAPMKDWNPQIVFLDNELPNTYDKVIVVGGYMVNEVAKMLAQAYPELQNEVQKAGDIIVKKVAHMGKEYIVVYGYTAEDTGRAASQFISWLRQNVA